MLEHDGNSDVALSLAQTARRGMPESPNSADTLGWAYYKKGAYLLSLKLLQDAANKAPENATYQYHLGLAYYKAGDASKAKMHLRRALELDPKSVSSSDVRKVLAELDTKGPG